MVKSESISFMKSDLVLVQRSVLTRISSSLVAINAHESAHKGSDSLELKLQSSIELWMMLLQSTLMVYWA